MGDKTGIEWTDATWNPVAGCSVTSPGCTNCYAMRQAARIERMGVAKYRGLTQPSKAGPVWSGTVRLDPDALEIPLRWRKPRRIFVNSMSDLFHEALSDEAIDRVFAVMQRASRHTFQVLTKRAERMRDYVTALYAEADDNNRRWFDRGFVWPLGSAADMARKRVIPFPNVWLGVSVEDQARADERIPALQATPAAVRFLSCEPLLGPVTLNPDWLPCPDCRGRGWYLERLTDNHGTPCARCQCEAARHGLEVPDKHYARATNRIDWVIVGGESGPGARPMSPAWARSLRDQCAPPGVPFFFKQWGEWHSDALLFTDVGTGACPPPSMKIGKKRAGRLLDGREHNAFAGERHG